MDEHRSTSNKSVPATRGGPSRRPRRTSTLHHYYHSTKSSDHDGGKQRTFVEHRYHDHLHDANHEQKQPCLEGIVLQCEKQSQPPLAPRTGGPRGGVTVAFPEKLHDMLTAMDVDDGTDRSDVISWQPHGRCFLIHKKRDFVEDVMPRFFQQSKLTSFQRQLNLYGFRRLTTGKDRGSYYHELFLRSRPDLSRLMTRTKVKGNGMKPAASPETEPDFYAMEYCPQYCSEGSNKSSSLGDCPPSAPLATEQAAAETYSNPASLPTALLDPTLPPDLLEFDLKEENKEIPTACISQTGMTNNTWSFSSLGDGTAPETPGLLAPPMLVSPPTSPHHRALFQPPELPSQVILPGVERKCADSHNRATESHNFREIRLSTHVIPTPSSADCLDDLASSYSASTLESTSTMTSSSATPSAGDSVYFEGQSFRYLDRLDLEDFARAFETSGTTVAASEPRLP